MINNRFEVYKIKREIKRSGTQFEILKTGENEYGEKDESVLVSVYASKGLYHEIDTQVGSHITLTTGVTTQWRSLKRPAIMVPFEEVSQLNFQTGYIVKINNKNFRLVKVINIHEWNLIADISLEDVDVGL